MTTALLTKPHRVRCCVPFCRRTVACKPGGETICWEHWKHIPLARRRAYVRAVAERVPEWLRDKHRPTRWTAARPHRSRIDGGRRSITAVFRLWDALKRDAIGRAVP